MMIDADKYGTVTVGPEMINDKMLARWNGTAQRFRRLSRNFVTPDWWAVPVHGAFPLWTDLCQYIRISWIQLASIDLFGHFHLAFVISHKNASIKNSTNIKNCKIVYHTVTQTHHFFWIWLFFGSIYNNKNNS